MYDFPFIAMCLRLYKFRQESTLSIAKILKITKVSRSTLYEWVRKFLETQKLDLSSNKFNTRKFNRSHDSYQKLLTEEQTKFILDYVAKNPQFNFKNLRKKVEDLYQTKINKSFLCYLLKKNNITRKRVQRKTYPKNDVKYNTDKENLRKNLNSVRRNYVSIDETSVLVGIKPNYGYSIKGKKCVINNKQAPRLRFSVVMAITKERVLAYHIVKGGIKGNVFSDFIKNKVLPKTKKALLFDNASIHRTKELKTYMNDNKRKYIYNVSYSPEFNPIEYVFNTFKIFLKQQQFSSLEQLKSVIKKFNKSITGNTLVGYYKKSLNNLYGPDDNQKPTKPLNKLF